jgi:hypothetical protein
LCAAPVELAQAQQKAQVYRIAVVHPSDPVGIMSETGSRYAYHAELVGCAIFRSRADGAFC